MGTRISIERALALFEHEIRFDVDGGKSRKAAEKRIIDMYKEASRRVEQEPMGVLPSVRSDGSVLFVSSMGLLFGVEDMPNKLRLTRTGDMGRGHCAHYVRVHEDRS